ncbi:hypothetical protein BDR26DRAFT_934200 [Obelidium mucronatum]|nr:hypothetical protein BDR26DRAFT_934200 [Obelidium mucronatum]
MKRANEAQVPAESKKIRLDDTSTEPNMLLDILAQTVAKHQLVLTCNVQSTNGLFTAQYSAKSRMFKKSKKFPSEEAARNDAAALVIQALDPSRASVASRKKPPKKLMGDELILRFKETLGVDFGFSSRRNYNGNTISFCLVDGVEFGHTSGWGGSETLLQLANGLLNSPTADKEISAMKENDTAAKAERDLIEEEGIKKLFEKLTNAFSTDKLKPG